MASPLSSSGGTAAGGAGSNLRGYAGLRVATTDISSPPAPPASQAPSRTTAPGAPMPLPFHGEEPSAAASFLRDYLPTLLAKTRAATSTGSAQGDGDAIGGVLLPPVGIPSKMAALWAIARVDPPPVHMPAPLEALLQAMQAQGMAEQEEEEEEEEGQREMAANDGWSAALHQELEARAYRLYLEEDNDLTRGAELHINTNHS